MDTSEYTLFKQMATNLTEFQISYTKGLMDFIVKNHGSIPCRVAFDAVRFVPADIGEPFVFMCNVYDNC